MVAELKNIRTDNKAIRDFGILFGCLFLIIAGFLFYRVSDLNLSLVLLGSSFISLALILPVFLKPFYLLWMFFAVALGWFMTRLMLGLLFYLIVSPIGVISRLFGKEFLELNKSKLNNSYWNYLDSKKVNNQHYEKQF
tara:strand:- start:449 stop:862 length:414 start_codon:yes stop_codon:yes gene_type:complete